MSKVFDFGKDFLWGTATSGHQIEGNNVNSDWYQWEIRKRDPTDHAAQYPLEPSGIATDSYNRYEEDFELCKQLNNNAVRIGIEWNRIEPERGKFDQSAIEHYRKVLKRARDRGLKTFVTLFHFTLPLWLSKNQGWVNYQSPNLFARYSQKCANEFGDLIDTFLTINEPQVYILQSYIEGIWPPNIKNLFLATIAHQNLIRAHNKAFKEIKRINKDYQIGIVKNIVCYEYSPNPFWLLDFLFTKLLTFLQTDFFLLQIRKNMDIIGLNYYFTTRLKSLKRNNLDDIQNDLGWWVYPPGIEKVLLDLKKYNLPIYITENGCADKTDRIRKKFIGDHLKHIALAIQQGVDVKGYFHWSLIDNYEWHHGYKACFGLVEIDRQNNLKRIPRPSFFYFADICKSGMIEMDG